MALRSLHELLWAVVLLAAMGISSGAAVVALALPLVGTLGRVFAELLDEVDGRGATRLEAAGCGPVTAFLVVLTCASGGLFVAVAAGRRRLAVEVEESL